MTKRSLQASNAGIEKARRAFKLKAWTQQYLAGAVGIETRQPIWKFFKGKPIERHIFIDICAQLDLEWQEIAQLPIDESNQTELIKTLRSQYSHKINVLCGTIRLLDIAQPIALDNIYVNVNILKSLSAQRWLEISQLQKNNLDNFDRFSLESLAQEKVPALDAVTTYSKLMVFGKPGAGKTTFLQNAAIQCLRGNLCPEQIPIFIKLKNLAEDTIHINLPNSNDIFRYIKHEFSEYVSEQQVEFLLQKGNFLILLDGLDEVREEDGMRITNQIRQFVENYYNNSFIISCRLGAQHYRFGNFTDIEIADFDYEQIKAFAKKWFVTIGSNSQRQGLAKASQFIEKIKLPQNQRIFELAITPLLLNLTCLVFQGRGDFPTKRSELYQQGLNILLVQWDKARGIKRDEIYKDLSLGHKIQLLSQIAAITFEQDYYFFPQNVIQKYIAKYLLKLSNTSLDPEELQLDSEAVLKSIEVQHGLLIERAKGIYSFSHLTFQEYLTAKYFVANNQPQVLEQNLQELVRHCTEPQWREVLLLAMEMLDNSDRCLKLMKQHIDAIACSDEELYKFIYWVNQKFQAQQIPYKSAAIRAFYLTLAVPRDLVFARDLNLALALDLRLAKDLALELSLDLALYRILNLSLTLDYNPTKERILTLSLAFPSWRDLNCAPELIPLLQQLKDELPTTEQSIARLKVWWNEHGKNWTEKLRAIIIQYRNIGHNWQFNSEQMRSLQIYYDANRFLIDCLHSDFNVSQSLRAEIEQTLLVTVDW